MTDLKVHPAAAVFPMLSEDELRDLAADIRENGQCFPIMLDEHGVLVDGRNRHAACGMAGVEPICERLPPGTDVVAYIFSANVQRRHMTQGQRAMAIAMMLDVDGGRTGGRALTFESKVSEARLSFAATIRKYASDLAPGVLAGTESFDRAYEAARARKREQDEQQSAADRQAREDAIELERLRRAAPDLAALVPDTLTVAGAKRELADREQRAREARESLARVAETALGFLDPGLKTTAEELAARIAATLDSSALATRPVFTAARFARVAQTAAAIARRLEAREGVTDDHAAARH